MNSFYSINELKELGIKNIGKNVLISKKASIYSPEKIIIGNHVRIDDFCILSGKIKLGSYVHIAAYAALYAGNTGIIMEDFVGLSSKGVIYAESDDYSGEYLTNPMVPMQFRNIIKGEVHIGRHVLIGTGTSIMPGVKIGDGATVGAMSLVNHDICEWTVNVGIPSRKIKMRSKNLLKLEENLNF